MNPRRRLVVLLMILTLPRLFAQAPADPPASREDVLELFEVMHIHEQMQLVMESTLKQQRAILHDMMKKQFPRTTDEELKRVDELMDGMVKDISVDDMLNDQIPIYQKHLAKSDVEAMIAFYSTPTGQKLLREMPAMASESMQASYPRMQAMMEKIVTRAQQLAKEEQEKKQQQQKAQPEKPDATPKPPTQKN